MVAKKCLSRQTNLVVPRSLRMKSGNEILEEQCKSPNIFETRNVLRTKIVVCPNRVTPNGL